MKTVISVVLIFAFAASADLARAQSQAPSPEPARTPIKPPFDCIHTDQIMDWYIVDPRTVIVKTLGPDRRYVVKLMADCPRLGIGRNGLVFRTSQANRTTYPNRICGEVGEAVRAREQPPCGIQSVAKIDATQYDTMSKQAIRHGNGITMPPSKPRT